MRLTRKRLDTILGHHCDGLPWGMQELVDEIRLLQAQLRLQDKKLKTFAQSIGQVRRAGWDAALDAAARHVTLDVCMEVPCLHTGCENDRILGRSIRALEYKEKDDP